MPALMNSRGEMVDLATGEVVGRAEGVPLSQEPRTAGQDQAPEGLDRVKGLINNLSWGFNSALFALPDAGARLIGKGLGLDEKDVFQLSRFFNKGEQPGRDPLERYTRAVGEGVGSALPLTGILAWAAKASPMVKVAEPGAGVLKGIANDAIKFVQQNPKLAAYTDVAFGAGYEGLRQAVEENVDPNNPNKQLYKELLPMGAFMGLPLAAANLPSVRGAKFIQDKIRSASSGLGEVEKETLAGLPGVYRLPVVRAIPSMLMKNAERKLTQVFGPIAESPEAQQALKQLEIALADPRVANAGFLLDAAESTMYGPLLQRKAELLNQLGPKELEGIKQRISENQQKLASLFDSFSPQARQPIEEAFRAAQQDRQAFFENLLRQQKQLTDAEIMSVSERLGPQNMDTLNDELRGVLMANMEMDTGARRQILEGLGFRQGYAPNGLPTATREGGASLFPAVDMENAAKALVDKYRIERPSLRTPLPEPVAMLDNFMRGQLIARDKLEKDLTKSLVDQAFDDQLAGANKTFDEEILKVAKNSARQLVGATTEKVAKIKGQRKLSLKDIMEITQGKGRVADAEGNVDIFITPGTSIRINPTRIMEDAKLMAQEQTAININLPEAMDYLQSAMRYRNDSLSRYNAAMYKGRARLTDAQRYLDTGNAVFNDVENLVLGHVPKINEEYGTLRSVIDNYKNQYEKSLPLLMSQRGGRGEFLLPNEQLMQKAFSSADNLRQLQTSLSGAPELDNLLERGAIDWLRSKGAVNQEGLVDPRKIRSILDKNRNIVEALPDSLQQRFGDEIKLADNYVTRMGELDQRRVAAGNNELDNLLAKASRPDADPKQTLYVALRDPAVMRNMVSQLGKDPEQLAALRRSVYDVATQGAQTGGSLKGFLDQNEKSLKVLFDKTGHLDDLRTLADLQRRVNAFADVTGQIPAFESLDDALKKVFGSGIQWLTTTAREAAVGRINPTTGSLALIVRLAGSLENQLYQRIFTRALEDPEFAKTITHIGTPQEAAKAAAKLEEIGISPTRYFPKEARLTAQAAADVAQQGREVPTAPGIENQPVVPRETARQMLQRALPPAPPVRGFTPNLRLPVAQPAQNPQIPLMYPSMFPNDPISALLQQRQAQMQGQQR